MGNPESKVKKTNPESKKEAKGKSVTDKLNTKSIFPVHASNVFKTNISANSTNSAKTIEKTAPIQKKRINFNDESFILGLGINLIGKAVNEQIDKRTNLNFMLPLNFSTMSSLNALVDQNFSAQKNIRNEIEDISKSINGYVEVSNKLINKQNKKFEFYKYNNYYAEGKFNKFFKYEQESAKHNIELEFKKKIFFEDTLTSKKSFNNSESINLSTTTTSNKNVLNYEIAKITPNKHFENGNNTSKISNKVVNQHKKSSNFKSTRNSPPRDYSPTPIKKSVNKSSDRVSFGVKTPSRSPNKIKANPKVLLKINLKKERSSLVTDKIGKIGKIKNTNTSCQEANDDYERSYLRTEYNQNKTKALTKYLSEQTSINCTPRASKQNSINNSGSNAYASNLSPLRYNNQFDSPKVILNPGTKSYANLAKQKNIYVETEVERKEKSKPKIPKSTTKNVNTSSSKSIQNNTRVDLSKFKEKKIITSRKLQENENYISNSNENFENSMQEQDSMVRKQKPHTVFKIDLSRKESFNESVSSNPRDNDDELNDHNLNKQNFKSTTLMKLNKLKNLKNKIKKCDLVNENSRNNTNIDYNTLDIIRESLSQETEDYEAINKFSFQKRCTPTFDVKNKYSTNNEVYGTYNDQVKYNFNINEKIQEHELRDVDGIDQFVEIIDSDYDENEMRRSKSSLSSPYLGLGR